MRRAFVEGWLPRRPQNMSDGINDGEWRWRGDVGARVEAGSGRCGLHFRMCSPLLPLWVDERGRCGRGAWGPHWLGTTSVCVLAMYVV